MSWNKDFTKNSKQYFNKNKHFKASKFQNKKAYKSFEPNKFFVDQNKNNIKTWRRPWFYKKSNWYAEEQRKKFLLLEQKKKELRYQTKKILNRLNDVVLLSQRYQLRAPKFRRLWRYIHEPQDFYEKRIKIPESDKKRDSQIFDNLYYWVRRRLVRKRSFLHYTKFSIFKRLHIKKNIIERSSKLVPLNLSKWALEFPKKRRLFSYKGMPIIPNAVYWHRPTPIRFLKGLRKRKAIELARQGIERQGKWTGFPHWYRKRGLSKAYLGKSRRYLFYLFVKKTINNYFVTLTNGFGNVRISSSAGKIGVYGKKKKKTVESLRDIVIKVGKIMSRLGIRKIFILFIKHLKQKFVLRIVLFALLGVGVYVRQIKLICTRAHNGMREKKQKRL